MKKLIFLLLILSSCATPKGHDLGSIETLTTTAKYYYYPFMNAMESIDGKTQICFESDSKIEMQLVRYKVQKQGRKWLSEYNLFINGVPEGLVLIQANHQSDNASTYRFINDRVKR